MHYDEIVITLKKEGYKVNSEGEITGKNLLGYLYKKSPMTTGTQIFIDHKYCYNKLGDCVIKVPFPENKTQLQKLLDKMKWAGSGEGYEASNEYDFEKYMNGY